MAAVSASTTLLLTDPMLQLLESTWAIVDPDVTLIVAEASGIATAMITGTGIGTETVTVIALRVATTGTVVIETRIETGATEGALAVIRLPAGGEAPLPALVGPARDVPVNVVIAINPKSWRYSAIDSPSRDTSHYPFQVIKFRVPFTVLYQDFKLKLFRQLA